MVVQNLDHPDEGKYSIQMNFMLLVPAQQQAVLSPRRDFANAQWDRYINGTDQQVGGNGSRGEDQEIKNSKL